MNDAMKALYDERMLLRHDLLEFRQPKRVPVTARFSLDSACGLAGIDLRKAMYSPALMEKAMTTVCETFYSDSAPFSMTRLPLEFQVTGSANSMQSSSGTIQHPEFEGMRADDYDAFIEDPVTTLIEVIHPRVLKSLRSKSPEEVRLAALRGYIADQDCKRVVSSMFAKMDDRYGYMKPFGGGPMSNIPFDYLADHLRGFGAALIDLRRRPEKVKAANAVLLKIIKWLCNRPSTEPDGVSWLALHMPAFMSTRQFEEFYWEDFLDFIIFLNGLGWHCTVFVEGDWERYYGHMDRLPHYKTSFQCEEGDPARMKETFGRHHFFGGLYDPTITLVYDKERCIDEAKRLVDICGKDGGFYFCFNKNVIDIKSVDVNKLAAVLEWVRDKAIY